MISLGIGLGITHGGATAYSPVDALGSDLVAYFEAERADLISAGSWRDVKAGYDATQATGTAQPAYSATAFGGGAVVTGDGVDDTLTCTDAGLLAALPSGANPGEIWVLCSQAALPADTTVRMIVDYGNGATTGRRIRRSVASSVNRASAQVGTGATTATATDSATDLSSRHVIRAQFTATDVIITVDGGTPVTSAGVSATTASRFRLFAGSSGSPVNFWEGGLAAALVTQPLSAAKADALQSYLLTRRKL